MGILPERRHRPKAQSASMNTPRIDSNEMTPSLETEERQKWNDASQLMTPERMPLEMSQQSRKEVLEKMKQRYARRPGREARGRLLDEVCELCGYERKHALKVLGGRVPIAGGKSRRGGPRRRYGEEEKAVLKAIWLAAEQPCGKRLKAAVPLWLPHYENRQCKLVAAVRERLLKMSAATMDRMLKAVKIQLASRGR